MSLPRFLSAARALRAAGGGPAAEAPAMFHALDGAQSGLVTLDEFVKVGALARARSRVRCVRATHTRCAGVQEVRRVWPAAHAGVLADAFAECDRDGDGRISYGDFEAALVGAR